MLGFPVKYVNLFGKKIEVTHVNLSGCINQDFFSKGFWNNGQYFSYQDMFGIPSHGGWDFTQFFEDPILNVADGTVIYAQRQYGANGEDYGNLVIVWHPELGIQTSHRHMFQILCNRGDIVPKGFQLAKAGTTGFSTGNHSHYEIRKATGLNLSDVIQNEWKGAIDPTPFYQDMRYIVSAAGNQYLVFDSPKVAIGIADVEELQKLQQHGLTQNLEQGEVPSGYLVYPGIETSRLRDIFNI